MSREDLQALSVPEKKAYLAQTLRLNFPYTRYSERLRPGLHEALYAEKLTYLLYNWQWASREAAPKWITHDGPPFASGRPHLG